MNEQEARHLFLVRAVELEDAAEAVLTREDRQQATGAALGQLPRDANGGRRRADEAFLIRRSEFAFSRLESRFPVAGKACRTVRWPSWISWAVPTAALAIGVATNEIDNGARLSIIAFPLIGMLAWNLAIYGLLLAGALRTIAQSRPVLRAGLLVRLLARAAARSDLNGQAPLSRGLARFTRDWLGASAELTTRRVARTLHLAAAALAAGVLVGMYLRALGVEYLAGWESTFIGVGTLHNLLEIVLGPASWLTGIALPDPEHLRAIRWRSGSGGENAGPWIHLYATTAAIFIIGPRLLLAAGNAARALHLQRRFPIPGPEDFYMRRLLRGARREAAKVRVIPYSFHASPPTQRRLRHILEEVLGDGTHVAIDTPVLYGGEDEWLAAADVGHDVDHVVVLFNLSATPEAENHGALVAGLRSRLIQSKSGAGLTVLVEGSAYRERLAGQAGAEQRLEARRLAWKTMLARQAAPLFVDLDDSDVTALSRRVEGALIKEAALGPGGGVT